MKRPDELHSQHEHPEDLVALERRGPLDEAKRRRLQLCLHASADLRALHQVGCAMDQEREELPGDDVLLARVALRARRRVAQKKSVRWGRFGGGIGPILGAATLFLGTLAAAAAVWQMPQFRGGSASGSPEISGSPAADPSNVPPARQTKPRLRLAVEAPELPAQPPNPQPQPVPSATERLGTGGVASASAHRGGGRVLDAPESPSPAVVFSQANAARRRGELGEAVGLYHQLERAFPASPEARLSHLMVGQIYLGQGRSALALDQFQRSLRAEPQGALVPEALYGKAEALRRLGRVAEECAAWEALIERSPKGPYADAARRRLLECHGH